MAVVASHRSPPRVQHQRLVGARGAGLGERDHALGERHRLHPGQRAVLVTPQRDITAVEIGGHGDSGNATTSTVGGPSPGRRPGGPAPLVTVIRMRASLRLFASHHLMRGACEVIARRAS